jgi:hypothetical protein
MMRPLRWGIVFLALLPAVLLAQAKKPPAKEDPRVLLALPLGVMAGKTTQVTLRGVKLDAVTEVRLSEAKGVVKLLPKGQAAAGSKRNTGLVGESSLEIEVTLPADVSGPTVTLRVITPMGESLPHPLFVDRTPVLSEKEPNNGFAQAQLLELGQTVAGTIAANQDVDVFRFKGQAGQKVSLEVFAARYGSALDSFLTLYNSQGQILATSDDIEGSTDSRIDFTLPATGIYYLGLLDANDQGGPTHVYRLSVRAR